MTKNDCYLGFIGDLQPGEVGSALDDTALKDFKEECEKKMVTWFVLTKSAGLLLPYEIFKPPSSSQSKNLVFNKVLRQLSQFRKSFLFMPEEDRWCFELMKYLRSKGIWIAQINDLRKIVNTSKDVVVTKTEYFALLKALERKVAAFKPEVIVGLKKGGTLPAAYCAERLGCLLFNLSISRYHNRKPSTPVITGSIPKVKGKRVAVIDDLIDEGKTMSVALAKLREGQPSALKPFVLLFKEGATLKVEYVRKVPRRWVTLWYD